MCFEKAGSENFPSPSNPVKQMYYSYLLRKLNTNYFLEIWRKVLAVALFHYI